eukprot:scaffold13406_cov29-Tisochrysis_lutea.AAC.1
MGTFVKKQPNTCEVAASDTHAKSHAGVRAAGARREPRPPVTCECRAPLMRVLRTVVKSSLHNSVLLCIHTRLLSLPCFYHIQFVFFCISTLLYVSSRPRHLGALPRPARRLTARPSSLPASLLPSLLLSPRTMPDDWEDEDDWEAADLSLPQQGNEEVWSDEEAHHAEPEPLHAPSAPKPAPPKEKTGLEKKIEEREKREAEEAARLAALREAAGVTTEIDPSLTGEAAERARRKLLEEAADFDNAASAFGLDVATENAAAPAPAARAAATPKSAPEPAPKPAVSKPPPEAVRPDPKVDLPDDFLVRNACTWASRFRRVSGS